MEHSALLLLALAVGVSAFVGVIAWILFQGADRRRGCLTGLGMAAAGLLALLVLVKLVKFVWFL